MRTGVPAEFGGLAREAVAGQRRDDEVERVGGVAPVLRSGPSAVR